MKMLNSKKGFILTGAGLTGIAAILAIFLPFIIGFFRSFFIFLSVLLLVLVFGLPLSKAIFNNQVVFTFILGVGVLVVFLKMLKK